MSKTERHLFEPQNAAHNVLPPRDIPGPGKYDRQDAEKNRNFNAKGEESVFLSRVPNCKDAKIRNVALPGPGQYQQRAMKNGDSSDLASRGGVTTADTSMAGDSTIFFGSKTMRGQFWKNELDAPYTKATFNKAPGPGSYLASKKKEDIRARLL